MPLYVMVTADFPDVDSSKRAKIYECLEKKHWTKVSDIGRDISTVWYASFKEGVSYEEAISITKDRFMNCAKPYTIPKLAIHAGPNKPSIYRQ